jgi:type II secretory pathway pseudopilin PulG
MVKTKAFTFSELLLALILLSAMVTVAIVSLSKVLKTTSEQRAALNLRAIHAANEIFRVKQGGYWNTNLPDVDAINTNLKVDIIAGDADYSYSVLACEADDDCSGSGWSGVCLGGVCAGRYSADASNAGFGFSLRINQAVISATNPCCSAAGTCPNLPDCP